ncbi:MAG TPA: tRNA (N6-threonylcarbamoyladenosine(37)-N6)-methyltransferase TrmO [Candidatus Udaeobacter sp.]|nr:tRNA (N6-threonylcarbamoyladenosine(37)-N6)-methyltransferase TrmO [Candidatus Udaeobacter sp.]
MSNKPQSEGETKRKHFRIKPVGFIRSDLKRREEAPRQGREGAPNALIEVLPSYVKALHRMQVGDEIIIISWLHRAERNVLEVHPRADASRPLTGVFSTRSPDRPNPLGLHRVKVLKMTQDKLHVGPIEAIDGTPVIDIKPVLSESANS